MWLRFTQKVAVIPKSRTQAILVFLFVHALYWAVAFLTIRGNELSLHERLGIPLSGAGAVLGRAVSLTIVPALYGGVSLIGGLVVLAVYGLVAFSVVRIDRKPLFYGAVLAWGLYSFTMLVAVSAGMRS